MRTLLLSQFARALAFALLAAGLTACGKGDQSQVDVGSFGAYVESFKAAAEAQGHPVEVTSLKIEFGQVESTLDRGDCKIGGDAVPTIVINQDDWTTMSETDREELLFHELGHCVLHRFHDTAVGNNGYPASIMYPYNLSPIVYVDNRAAYLEELFSAKADF